MYKRVSGSLEAGWIVYARPKFFVLHMSCGGLIQSRRVRINPQSDVEHEIKSLPADEQVAM